MIKQGPQATEYFCLCTMNSVSQIFSPPMRTFIIFIDRPHVFEKIFDITLCIIKQFISHFYLSNMYIYDVFYHVVVVIELLSHVHLYRLQPSRLHCPWNSPGKNTGVGSHSPLQGIFLTQESNPCLLHLLLASRFFTTEPPEKWYIMCIYTYVCVCMCVYICQNFCSTCR